MFDNDVFLVSPGLKVISILTNIFYSDNQRETRFLFQLNASTSPKDIAYESQKKNVRNLRKLEDRKCPILANLHIVQIEFHMGVFSIRTSRATRRFTTTNTEIEKKKPASTKILLAFADISLPRKVSFS